MNTNIIFKNILIIGILYVILKKFCSSLDNKDIFTILIIINVILYFITFFYNNNNYNNRNYECFTNMINELYNQYDKSKSLIELEQLQANILSYKLENNNNNYYTSLLDSLLNNVKNKMTKIINNPTIPPTILPTIPPTISPSIKPNLPQIIITQIPNIITEAPINIEEEIKKIKVNFDAKIDLLNKDNNSKIDELKNELLNNNTKYYNSLVNELLEKGIITNSDIEIMNNKLKAKLLTITDLIISLEKLKLNYKPNNNDDNKYNEYSDDFKIPIGSRISNKWDNDYTLLNTDKWRVPMPRPPVCINNTPCKLCPNDSGYPLNLKEWDNSRKISDTNINTKWANDNKN